MKILLICFVGITFIIFLLTTSVVDTPWFSDYLKTYDNEMEMYICLIDIQRMTFLMLTSFLIAQASYFIKLNGESKRKTIELLFGLFFGSTIISELLISYYETVSWRSFFITQQKPYELKAENTIFTASDMYHKYGLLIEYYDFNKTKQQFKPTETDKENKKNIDFLNDSIFKKQDKIPLYLVLSFLVMVYAYYLGNLLAKRKIKKNQNINEDITNTRSTI